MNRSLRAVFIFWVVLRYGLDEMLLSSFQHRWLRGLARVLAFGRRLDAPRGQRLRQALRSFADAIRRFVAPAAPTTPAAPVAPPAAGMPTPPPGGGQGGT